MQVVIHFLEVIDGQDGSAYGSGIQDASVSCILAALNDEEAAALILRSCRQRSGLQEVLLQKLPALNDNIQTEPSVEPRKRARRGLVMAPTEILRQCHGYFLSKRTIGRLSAQVESDFSIVYFTLRHCEVVDQSSVV